MEIWGAITNNAAMNVGVHIYSIVAILQRKTPRLEGH